MSILYITYDGILEPLGQSQVLAYQEKLGKNFKIFLFSFEKPKDLENTELLESIQERIDQSSITWFFHKYHKFPDTISTLYDLSIGLFHCSYLVWRYKIKVVHARSYPPALIALFLKKIFRIKFIFDMRGFWADERVDGNIWKKGSINYRLTKSLEKLFIQSADHIISLTQVAVEEIKKFKYVNSSELPITVISTCVNLEKFLPEPYINKKDNFKFGYLGTVGSWYLFDDTIKAFHIGLNLIPSAKILIINKGEHDFIKSKLNHYKIPLSSVELIDANHSEVPGLLQEITAGVFFLKPLFSKQASAPTKLGEFLACGIPCLTNDGIGDMGAIIKNGKVGVTVKELNDGSIRSGLISLIKLTKQEDIVDRCVSVANKYFSLNDGIDGYRKIYKDFLQ